jgi:hypothetical protein
MNSIVSALTVVNEADIRGQALLALMTANLNVQGYYGFRSLGAASHLVFPCIMVDPISERAVMARLGKYDIDITYNIYFYLQESSPDAIVTQATFIGETLIKLFSNNALGDLQNTNPPSNKYKQYPNPGGGYYWLNSEMSDLKWSTSFLNATPDNQETYMRAGLMTFVVKDTVIK